MKGSLNGSVLPTRVIETLVKKKGGGGAAGSLLPLTVTSVQCVDKFY